MLHLSTIILAYSFSGLVHALPYSSGTPESFTNQTAIPTPISSSTAEGSRGHNSFTFATPSPSGSNSNYNVSGHRGPHESDHSIITVTVDCASASMFTNVPGPTGINSGGDATGSLGKPFSYTGDGATMPIPSGSSESSPSSDGFPSGPVASTPSDPDALPSDAAITPGPSSTSDAPEPVITNSESITDASPSSDSVTDEPEITGSDSSLVSDTTLPTTTLGARDDQGNSSANISGAASFTNIPSAGPITRVPTFTRQSGIPNKSAGPVSSGFMNGQPQARPSGMSFGGHGMKNGSGAPEGQKGARTVTVCAASLPTSA